MDMKSALLKNRNSRVNAKRCGFSATITDDRKQDSPVYYSVQNPALEVNQIYVESMAP